MPTNTFQSGGVDLKWSTIGNWSAGWLPVADEDVVIPNLIAVMDVARIPASGSLASLTATTGGQITIALDNATFHTPGASIFVTGDIQAGTKTTGFIYVGDSTAHVLNITATNIKGGSGSNAHGLYLNCYSTYVANITANIIGGSGASSYGCAIVQGTGAVNITGNCQGGPGANYMAHGVWNYYSIPVNITGNIIGGGAAQCHGFFNYASGKVTLINSSLINSAFCVAWGGFPPAWNPGNTYYQYWWTGAGSTIGAPNTYFYINTDPGVANVLSSATYYYNSGTVKTGTYHEATVAEVQDGVMFGAGSVLEGTYAGSGGGRPEIRGNNL